jgi:hypothetical protein
MLRTLRPPVAADADHSVPLLKDESSNGGTCPSTTVSIQPCSHQCHTKCTKPVLSCIFDAQPTEYQGGRGVSTILSSRDKPPRYLGLPDRYWTATIFNLQGRPAPILPLVFYTIYCVGAVAATLQFLANKHRAGGKPDTTYKEDMQFLQALQFPVAAIGKSLPLGPTREPPQSSGCHEECAFHNMRALLQGWHKAPPKPLHPCPCHCHSSH